MQPGAEALGFPAASSEGIAHGRDWMMCIGFVESKIYMLEKLERDFEANAALDHCRWYAYEAVLQMFCILMYFEEYSSVLWSRELGEICYSSTRVNE